MFIDTINHQHDYKKINCSKNFNQVKNIESNDFFKDIKVALDTISKTQNHANVDSQKFTLNQSNISLNDVMINLQKSSISIQMAVQIRNKIVGAYKEIMNQQV